MTATPTPLRELPAKWQEMIAHIEQDDAPDTSTRFYSNSATADTLHMCARQLQAALSARDEAGAVRTLRFWTESEQDDWEALRDSVADELAHLGAVNCLPDRFDEDEWPQIERALVAVGKFYRDKYATPPASGEAGAVDPNVDPRTGCYPDCEDPECHCREQATYHAGGVNYFVAYEAAQKTGIDYNQLCRALRFIFATPPASGEGGADGSLTYAQQRKVVEHITTELGVAIGLLQSVQQRAEAIDCQPIAAPADHFQTLRFHDTEKPPAWDATPPAASGDDLLEKWRVRYNELIRADRTYEAEQVLRCINDAKQFRRLAAVAPAGMDGWIPVSERLPELDRPVWLVDESGHVWIGARGDTGDGWLWGNAYDSLYRDVAGNIDSSDNEADDDYQPTHWHTLPKNVPAAPTPPATAGKE